LIQNLDINDFLKNYWQKKPLLIRAAFPNYQSPISAEELAGLACEEFVESRIITENKTLPKWSLENGPFPESRFNDLPKSHWTLLIQGLNTLFPKFDDLLHEFDFLPSWRIDDLMASYAAPEGSVGPHIDQYDVFLLQASGQRKWMVSEENVNDEDLERDLPLKIIKNFKAESEWILEAGDMLYLPPNVAHYGIGLNDCMTFSIGFRAPSHAELLSSYIDEHLTFLSDDLRYKDSDLTASKHSGEITDATINKIQALLLSHFSDKSKIKNWFGCFITEYLNDNEELISSNLSLDEFITQFKVYKTLRRPASIRANYILNDESLTLYINGEMLNPSSNSKDLAMLLCDQHLINYSEVEQYLSEGQNKSFLCSLFNSGFLEFLDE
jgi:50S ribosomal protein L16 3-hydroxylase